MIFRSAVPVIATRDVRASVEFYTSVLGFRQIFVFGDPPVYAGLQRDTAQVYLTLEESMGETAAVATHPEFFLWVSDVDQAFQEHAGRGARVVEPPSDRPWGARQYVIEDPNGCRIKVAELIDDEV